MDLLLITVAKNAFDVRSDYYTCLDANVGSTISRENLQLAALRALLASLLSPSHVRPPYLSEGLELFRQGKIIKHLMFVYPQDMGDQICETDNLSPFQA